MSCTTCVHVHVHAHVKDSRAVYSITILIIIPLSRDSTFYGQLTHISHIASVEGVLDTSIRPGLSKFLPLSSERAARTGARRAHRCHSTPWRFFPSTSLSVLPRRFSFINIIAVPRSFLGRLFLLFVAVAVRTPFGPRRGRAASAVRGDRRVGVPSRLYSERVSVSIHVLGGRLRSLGSRALVRGSGLARGRTDCVGSRWMPRMRWRDAKRGDQFCHGS